jgi:hypothetical protein
MTPIDIPSIAFYLICALTSSLVAVLVFVFTSLIKKIDRLTEKIDSMEQRNAIDHAVVQSSLARMEEGIKSLSKDVDRHERRLGDLEG